MPGHPRLAAVHYRTAACAMLLGCATSHCLPSKHITAAHATTCHSPISISRCKPTRLPAFSWCWWNLLASLAAAQDSTAAAHDAPHPLLHAVSPIPKHNTAPHPCPEDVARILHVEHLRSTARQHCHQHHQHSTTLTLSNHPLMHNINAVGPAPLRSTGKRKQCACNLCNKDIIEGEAVASRQTHIVLQELDAQ
jgi:hypothetical protein